MLHSRHATGWITAVVLVTSCGADTSAPACRLESFIIDLRGTVTIAGVARPTVISRRYSPLWPGGDSYTYLTGILVRGEPTGITSTAAWSLQDAGIDAVMAFQLGGSRAAGAVIPVHIAFGAIQPDGRGPILSATGAAAMLFLFVTADYRATDATGALTVRTAAPLTGTLAVTFLDGQSIPASLDADLRVLPDGPGCSAP